MAAQHQQEQDRTCALEERNDLASFLEYVSFCSHDDSHMGMPQEDQERLTISTIHKAKGLEWAVVAVPGVHEGSLPHFNATSADSVREERRLLYVSVVFYFGGLGSDLRRWQQHVPNTFYCLQAQR